MPVVSPSNLTGPFPSKGAAEDLKERLIDHLRAHPAPVGTRFLTEAELAERSGLSRSTVRRALYDLQKAGWVKREIGRGTFIGARAAEEAEVDSRLAHEPARPAGVKLRIGVAVLWQDSAISDWYSPGILRGIDLASGEQQASTELLGHTADEAETLCERLAMSKPDVLVCLAGSRSQTFVIRDAQRIGIPVVCAGAEYRDFGLPTVCEDNKQAVRLAYDHLVEHGHERIGLLLTMQQHPFVFERLAAFRDRCDEGSGFDSGSVHWINADGGASDIAPEADRVPAYVDRFRPTAVICGNAVASRVLGLASFRHRLDIPRSLSTVSFDQSPEVSTWLGLAHPTTIAMPLQRMGRELARAAGALHRGESFDPVTLTCELVPGDSVADASPT